MEPREQQLVIILADISGYTRFMVETQVAAVHGQVTITLLIETLLAEVDIPLTLHGIEGDAVLLSAAHPGSDEGWSDVLAQVRTKLTRFFEVFLAAIVRAAEVTPCECPACANVDQLKLKIIVHAGRAVFHTIAGLPQISGTDVIIAHRLLKNSVPSGEYLLMTDAAYEALGRGMNLEFQQGEELCEGIGKVRTWVHIMGDLKEDVREAFYARPEAEVAGEVRNYSAWIGPRLYRAIFEQLRHPAVKEPWPKRLAFALRHAIGITFEGDAAQAQMRERLLAKRAVRQSGATGDGTSA
jgi:class 3 adenylate cyclase